MLFTKSTLLTAALTLSSLVTAQVPTTTPDGEVKVHVVQVGDREGNLKFYPEELTNVQVGELVQFHFYPQNHSIAQSTFAEPCRPMPQNGTAVAGFFSGFMPVKLTDNFMPTFTIRVNTTAPIWYYCATGQHCQRGMGGVINPPQNVADRTLARYKQLAANTTTRVPGGAPGNGGIVDPDGEPVSNSTGNPVPSATPSSDADGGSAGSVLSANTVSVVLGAVAAAFFLA